VRPALRQAHPRAQLPVAAVLALALVALAALTSDGQGLAADTWCELVLLALGAAGAVTVLALGARAPAWGAAAVLAFGALAALSAASTLWSVTPDRSWIEAGQVAGYLSAFGIGAAAARLAPARWPALLGAIALTAVAICGWAALAKALTLSVDDQVAYGRLLVPFTYWNATGLMAAIGLPPLVWAAAWRGLRPIWRGLASAGLVLMLVVLVLCYSRTALAAALAGCAVAIALGQERLRRVLMLAAAGVWAGALLAWALGSTALTRDASTALGHISLASRRSADTTFGLTLLGALLLAAVTGTLLARVVDASELPRARRRRIGAALWGLAALVPVAALVALAASSRGLTGEIAHLWRMLTSARGHVGNSPSRLTELSNTRPIYWHQGLSVAVHHLLLGAGADSFGIAHLRYPSALLLPYDAQPSHAHSYVVQTFADLGLAGLAVSLALLIAWGLAARATLLGRRPLCAEAAAERGGLVVALGIVIAYGVSSGLDWTWFFPGVSVPPLLAAGWLAGRGPLPAGVGLRPSAERRLLSRPGLILTASAGAALTLLIAWAIWLPLRSQQLADAGNAALVALRGGAALADERAAESAFPVAIQPLAYEADVQRSLHDLPAARAALENATRVQPQNYEPWLWLGSLELAAGERAAARRALRRAARLDLPDPQIASELAEAAAGRRAQRRRRTSTVPDRLP
jgi:tetratricopeptide (TPR) repeat protein